MSILNSIEEDKYTKQHRKGKERQLLSFSLISENKSEDELISGLRNNQYQFIILSHPCKDFGDAGPSKWEVLVLLILYSLRSARITLKIF